MSQFESLPLSRGLLSHARAGAQLPAVVVGAAACGLGLVRSLAKGNIPVIVIDTKEYEPAMRSRFARGVIVRALTGRALVGELLALAKSLSGPAVLFPTTDEQVEAVSEFRTDLMGTYRFSLPRHQTLASLMSKSSFKAFAEAYGFPVPRSITIEDASHLNRLSNLTYPCIIKSAIKNADYTRLQFPRAYRVTTKAQAATVCRQVLPVVPNLVVQEWIEGPDSEIYFCLQYRAADGSTVCSFTGRKLSIWPPDVGVTAACTAAPEVQPILQPLTEAFFNAASHVGMGSMEFKRDARNGQFFMIEPTVGRADLQEEVATLHGANIPLAAYFHEAGLEVPAVQRSSRSVVWRGSWAHTGPAQVHNANRDGTPRSCRSYDAYWRLNDPMPALFHAGRLLGVIAIRSNGCLRKAWKWANSHLASSLKW
jgi:D-aspartate ligase